jgi:hypothetical protein
LLEDRLKVKLQDVPATRVQHWCGCAGVSMNGTVSFEELARFHKWFFGTAGSRACPLEGFCCSGGLIGFLRRCRVLPLCGLQRRAR